MENSSSRKAISRERVSVLKFMAINKRIIHSYQEFTSYLIVYF